MSRPIANLCPVKKFSLVLTPVYTFPQKKKKKIIRFATLLFRKQALTPANSIKLFDTLVGKNSTVKKKDSLKFRKFFMNTSGNSTSFLIDPWNFHMLFFNIPGIFMSSTPSITFLDFF